MTKDKKYIEYLLRNYKKKKSRLRILNLGLINEDDNILNGIDYSKDKIQTSNLTSLDDAIIKREEEIKRLNDEIFLTEALLDSLVERDYKLIYSYYIERKTLVRIAQILDRDDTKTIWRNKERILDELLGVLKGEQQ